ncbi:MAG: hydantoin racemase [Burkholderiales bacterium]|jgi:allantoin racemase|nr:hydantoin racemase [Burkholderiales bacterium]
MKTNNNAAKTVAVIVINDPDMINQDDFVTYQTSECYFKVYHIDKTRKEYNTAAEGAEARSLVIKKICEVEKDGVSAAVVHAFADVGVEEARKLVSIPVISLASSCIHMASMLCRNYFTVIIGLLSFNESILPIIDKEGLNNKFIPVSNEIGLSAAQLKNDPRVLPRLIDIASFEIANNKVDTFTLGCGFFFGYAKLLEKELRKKFKQPIIVIDPVALPLKLASAL